ncbi:MAG TPA: ABC transporter ATP-binding protein [Stellaceae bacterium]|nr:ABC transporter ATP-binding protein [Stellaceae bacterium]
MTAPGLETEGLTLRLGRFSLDGVSLEVAPGEILVLLGRNGAGKSVCLETIAGFHRPQCGRIRIAGRDVTALSPERRRIGFVLQNFGLFPHLTVARNVAIGGEARGGAAGRDALLERFGIAHLAQSRPAQLSPGEKQRTALARALASRPDLFLFDEPFSALDAATSETLRDELGGFLRCAGIPAVFVTHDRTDALALGDRIAVIEGGAIRQHGPTAAVFARPGSIAIARLLGIENILEGRVAAAADDRLSIALGDGSLEAAQPAAALAPGQPVTLCIPGEAIRLLPPQSPLPPQRRRARVAAQLRAGPLWKIALECGFPLTAYALPQTLRECALVPGGIVDIEIDADAIHVLAAERGSVNG